MSSKTISNIWEIIYDRENIYGENITKTVIVRFLVSAEKNVK